ncbi:MAG: hypothetical protein R8K50_06270 [Mariprofundus sp.]
MKIMKATHFLIILFVALSSAQPALGWETDITSKYTGWLSIYNSFGKTMKEEAKSKDEHLALSDWALRELGVSQYSYNSTPIIITDLNASYFRVDDLGKSGSYLNSSPFNPDEYELEVRQLPAPSHFSGLPDFSYALHDWINKNTYCPAKVPLKEGVEPCYKFMGWMGALNSNHFGTQAKISYWHLHRLALNLANHAKDLRKTFSKDKTAIDAYREYVREAEREALSVEGYAQHFMQDMWSTGHMWERWDAPDYDHLPDKDYITNLIVAAFTGLLHGSEGVTGLPDALSSPQVDWVKESIISAPRLVKKVEMTAAKRYLEWYSSLPGQSALKPFAHSIATNPEKGRGQAQIAIPTWVFGGANKLKQGGSKIFPGLGDDRFLDMLDEGFGKEYSLISGDYNINVSDQKQKMRQCLMAGWAEVIRTFGSNPEGGFGVENAKLKGSNQGFNALQFPCHDQWATNASIALGWFDVIGNLARPFGTFARSLIKIDSKGNIGLKNIRMKPSFWSSLGIDISKQEALASEKQRLALQKITFQIYEYGRLLKKYTQSTTLAQNIGDKGIGDFGTAKTGNHYTIIADYAEPEDINLLPDNDEQGKDKKSWFGFFNRSHADYWCGEKGADLLKKIRGSEDLKTRKTCEYLANRFYEGTDPYYKGNYQEKRTLDYTENGQALHSVCHYFGGRNLWNPNTPNEVPFYLSGGYVGDPYVRLNRASDGYKTVANWCAKVPVLNYVREKNGNMNDETVARAKSWDDPITLQGEDLGMEKGKLWIDCNQFGSIKVPDDKIQNWLDSQIKFDLSWLPEAKRKEEVHSVCVETATGNKSVGNFLLVYEAGEEVKISGTISSSDGSALSGAVAVVEIGDKRYTGQSGTDGSYQVRITKAASIPDALIIMANKKRYNTGSTVVSKIDFQHADISLSKSSDNVIQIDKLLHHLGNSHFGGKINSQFQKPKAEGVSLSLSFEVSSGRLASDVAVVNAELRMTAKGLEEQNPVLINNKKVGILATSNPDGSATTVRLSLGPCILHSGENILTIKSADSNQNGDLDDFEFANIQLVFKSGKDMEPDAKRFAKLSSVHAMDAGFGGIIKKIVVTGQFAVSAKGKGECQSLKDVALVNIYREGKKEDSAIVDRLVETGPDSGVFHSDKPLTVKSIGAEAGEKIVIRSGIRGVSLLVVGKKIKLVGTWECQVADNHYQMRVTDVESDNKYIGVLTRQGKTSQDVGFSIGEHVWTARPLDNWTDVVTDQEWRWGKGGITEGRKWKASGLDLSRSNDDKLVLEDGRIFTRVKQHTNKGGKTRQVSKAALQKQEKTRVVKPAKQSGTSVAAEQRKSDAASGKRKSSESSGQAIKPDPPVKMSATQPGTISVNGGSRQLHAGMPVKAGTHKQSPVKPVKWTVYKLVVHAHGSRLPAMDVLKLSFQKGVKRAAFKVMRYPVSMVRNDQSGKILWRINWSAGDVVENEMAIQKDMIDALEKMADDKKRGGVEKTAIASSVNRQLGPDAQQKN